MPRRLLRRASAPWRLLRPLLAAGFLVSLLVAFIAFYLSPLSLRVLRDRLTEIRADILTNIVQPGRFTTIGNNLTFHIAGRRPNGLLLGIFIDDQRDPRNVPPISPNRAKSSKTALALSSCWRVAAFSVFRPAHAIRAS